MLQQRKMNDIGAAVTNKGVWPCGVWVQWHTTLPAARFVKRHWFGFNHLLHNSGSNEFKGLSAKHDVLWITWLWYCGSIFLHFSSIFPPFFLHFSSTSKVWDESTTQRPSAAFACSHLHFQMWRGGHKTCGWREKSSGNRMLFPKAKTNARL